MGQTTLVCIQRIIPGRTLYFLINVLLEAYKFIQVSLTLNFMFSLQLNLGSRMTPRYFTFEERGNLCSFSREKWNSGTEVLVVKSIVLVRFMLGLHLAAHRQNFLNANIIELLTYATNLPRSCPM